MNKTRLRSYARLIARTGANIQKGQDVLLYADLDQPEFVRILVEECYRAGARRVQPEWQFEPLEKLHARYQSEETLGETRSWEKAKLQHMVDTLPVRIYLESADPDGLTGIEQPKYTNAMQRKASVRKPYRDAIEGRHQWCIAAVPGAAWAKKMFPSLRKNQAVERLWEEILAASRANGDAETNWKTHNAALKARCDYLNSLDLRTLRYQSANGTDLSVGLIPGCRFLGGSEDTQQGVEFNPNIPSEEIFTSPDAAKTEGVVYSTKPLSFMGQLIENFSIRFESGRAVEARAQQGEELLRQMIAMDENAARLGEVALIPKESPISASGLLYYNTLFDENASCHLALGDGFEGCFADYDRVDRAVLDGRGLNNSIIHVDFMIGSDDMDIDGITADGKTVPIFRNGSWAF
ncbi:MAG: aminopeptidase [Ruminococcaceae bacterium]|nr:aminopeptidase [Oscillospiraceae bacterium]